MIGQGIMPQHYHPIVEMMADEDLSRYLPGLKASIESNVSKLPTHEEFIRRYCAVDR
jgi:tryptophan halogenase